MIPRLGGSSLVINYYFYYVFMFLGFVFWCFCGVSETRHSLHSSSCGLFLLALLTNNASNFNFVVPNLLLSLEKLRYSTGLTIFVIFIKPRDFNQIEILYVQDLSKFLINKYIFKPELFDAFSKILWV